MSRSLVVEWWALSVVVDPSEEEPAGTMCAHYDDGSYAVGPRFEVGPFDALADVLERGYGTVDHQRRLW